MPTQRTITTSSRGRLTRRAFGGRHYPAVLLWAAVIALSGCGLKEQTSTLEQKQRESIAEKTTANVVRESLVAPAPMTIETEGRDGSKSTITVPAVANTTTSTSTAASTASDSAASGNSAQTDRFPAWVAFIGYGVGALLAILVVWLILRASATARAAKKALDGYGAEVVSRLKSEAMNTKNDEMTAKLATLAADLDKSKQDWTA